MADVNMGLSVYEFNKNIMKQLPVIENLQGVYDKIQNYWEKAPFSEYLMLLSKERNDYTLFHFGSGDPAPFIDDIIECFANRGLGIVNTEIVDNGIAMEIWVKEPNQMEEADLYYLFPADQMVIEY
jgi:hypothetical protein